MSDVQKVSLFAYLREIQCIYSKVYKQLLQRLFEGSSCLQQQMLIVFSEILRRRKYYDDKHFIQHQMHGLSFTFRRRLLNLIARYVPGLISLYRSHSVPRRLVESLRRSRHINLDTRRCDCSRLAVRSGTSHAFYSTCWKCNLDGANALQADQ